MKIKLTPGTKVLMHNGIAVNTENIFACEEIFEEREFIDVYNNKYLGNEIYYVFKSSNGALYFCRPTLQEFVHNSNPELKLIFEAKYVSRKGTFDAVNYLGGYDNTWERVKKWGEA